jgi:hypothetical protein
MTMIFIVLSLVQINASRYRSVRQTVTEECLHPDFPYCQFMRCDNGGECVGNKTIVDCYKCICTPGFTGKLCDAPIVSPMGCNPPCQNGGTCERTGTGTLACVCQADFTGNQCETSVIATHPCVTSPNSLCLNGGTCAMNGAGFLCSCAIGFTGTNCQTQQTITTCNPNPCGAHGTCIQAVPPNGPGILCNCENRWTGQYCDVNLDVACPTGFCLSGGTCRTNGNLPYCECPPTHTGTRCESTIGIIGTTTTTAITITMTSMTTMTTTSGSTIRPNPGSCSANSCLNGGSCFNTGNDFVCLCTPQWSGPTCSVQSAITTPRPTTVSTVNACSPNPCTNGGTCYKYGSSYVCVCPSQYSGLTCSVAATTITPSVTTPSTAITCANQPCQNGGVCYNTGSSYFCYCGTGSKFTGANCETAIAPVSADCPLDCGSGTCVKSGGQQVAYACMCNGTLSPTRC